MQFICAFTKHLIIIKDFADQLSEGALLAASREAANIQTSEFTPVYTQVP